MTRIRIRRPERLSKGRRRFTTIPVDFRPEIEAAITKLAAAEGVSVQRKLRELALSQFGV